MNVKNINDLNKNKLTIVCSTNQKYLQYVNYIYTEVNTEQVYKGCDEIGQIDEYLKQFDFERVETRVYQHLGWGDAFYIKSHPIAHKTI